MRLSTALTTVLTVAVLGAAPIVNAGSFNFHFHNGHGGISFGTHGWSVYSDSWSNPNWSFSYETALDGHGEWLWIDGLGRVWRPYVSTNWRPYTYGRWVNTNFGLTWVAYEPWGYFPHHYGEWALTSYGWAWKPGYVYRPANVVWVSSNSYVGWYAKGPHGWSHHHRGSYRHGYSHGYDQGYDRGYWDGREDAYHATYVSWHDFNSDNISRHCASPKAVARTSTGHRVHTREKAPSRHEISRHGGRSVPHSTVQQRKARVGGRDIVMTRPTAASKSIRRHAGDTLQRATPQSKLRTDTARGKTRATTTTRSSGSSLDRMRVDTRRQTPPARDTKISATHRSGQRSTAKVEPRTNGRMFNSEPERKSQRPTMNTSSSRSQRSVVQRQSKTTVRQRPATRGSNQPSISRDRGSSRTSPSLRQPKSSRSSAPVTRSRTATSQRTEKKRDDVKSHNRSRRR